MTEHAHTESTLDQIKRLSTTRIAELDGRLALVAERERELASERTALLAERAALANIDGVFSGKYRPTGAAPASRGSSKGAGRPPRDGSLKSRILAVITEGRQRGDHETSLNAIAAALTGVETKSLYNAVAQLKREGTVVNGSKRGLYQLRGPEIGEHKAAA